MIEYPDTIWVTILYEDLRHPNPLIPALHRDHPDFCNVTVPISSTMVMTDFGNVKYIYLHSAKLMSFLYWHWDNMAKLFAANENWRTSPSNKAIPGKFRLDRFYPMDLTILEDES